MRGLNVHRLSLVVLLLVGGAWTPAPVARADDNCTPVAPIGDEQDRIEEALGNSAHTRSLISRRNQFWTTITHAREDLYGTGISHPCRDDVTKHFRCTVGGSGNAFTRWWNDYTNGRRVDFQNANCVRVTAGGIAAAQICRESATACTPQDYATVRRGGTPGQRLTRNSGTGTVGTGTGGTPEDRAGGTGTVGTGTGGTPEDRAGGGTGTVGIGTGGTGTGAGAGGAGGTPEDTAGGGTGGGSANGERLVAREPERPRDNETLTNQGSISGRGPIFRAGSEADGRYYIGAGCAAGQTTGSCQRIDVVDRSGIRLRNAGTADINRLGAGGIELAQFDPAADPSRTGDRTSSPDDIQTAVEESRANTSDARRNTSARNNEDVEGLESVSGNPCGVSAKLDAKFGCTGTQRWVEGAKISNQVSQTASQVVVGAMGQSALQNSAQAGTQSAALESAANLQATTAKMQMGMGAVNAALGVMQLQQARKHKAAANQIDQQLRGQINVNARGDQTGEAAGHSGHGNERGQSGFATSSGMTQTALDQFGHLQDRKEITQEVITDEYIAERVNQLAPLANDPRRVTLTNQLRAEQRAQLAARQSQINQKSGYINREVRKIRATGKTEQTEMAGQATQGGMMSAITGLQQLTNAFFGLKAAKEMKEASKHVQNLEDKGGILPGLGDPISADPPQAPSQGGAPVIGGDGTGPLPIEAPQTAEEDEEGDPSLGDPLPMGNDNSKIAGDAPKADPFVRTDPKVSGGGGGAPVGSANVSGSGLPPEGDSSARMADNKGGPSYVGGASSSFGQARGNGGGGDGGSGPDLSGLLAQFLPKPEEANQKPTSILNYDTGRAPASAQQPDSLLDRRANLFERISKTYFEKTQRGFVGPN